MGPHPSQQDAGLHSAVIQLQLEVTRQGLSLHGPRGLRWMGEQSGANISWYVASLAVSMVMKSINYHLRSLHWWIFPHKGHYCCFACFISITNKHASSGRTFHKLNSFSVPN